VEIWWGSHELEKKGGNNGSSSVSTILLRWILLHVGVVPCLRSLRTVSTTSAAFSTCKNEFSLITL
jgi:hypothetical protein